MGGSATVVAATTRVAATTTIARLERVGNCVRRSKRMVRFVPFVTPLGEHGRVTCGLPVTHCFGGWVAEDYPVSFERSIGYPEKSAEG
ncbi:hypothetical protein GCM10027184_00330 [Saccharothrix stipae]